VGAASKIPGLQTRIMRDLQALVDFRQWQKIKLPAYLLTRRIRTPPEDPSPPPDLPPTPTSPSSAISDSPPKSPSLSRSSTSSSTSSRPRPRAGLRRSQAAPAEPALANDESRPPP